MAWYPRIEPKLTPVEQEEPVSYDEVAEIVDRVRRAAEAGLSGPLHGTDAITDNETFGPPW
jgi:hypothetical protein